jgi:lysophospholipase L1-like esterase
MARRLAPLLAALLLLVGAGAAVAQTAPPGSLYIALGDSVAAGHGLGNPTGPNAAACTRSADAYPGLLTRSPFFTNPLGAGVSLACSGAVSANLLDLSQTAQGTPVPPQMAVVRALNLAPSTVTVTVGANDVGYNTVIDACIREQGAGPEGPCAQEAPRVVPILETLYANLVRLFGEINALPGTQRILATGYYDPFPEDDLTNIGRALTCGPIGLGIRYAQLDGDAVLLRAYLTLLNSTIAQAAAASGARYVDITRAFDGHRLCSDVPWVVPPSPGTIADGSAFHPTALGEEAIAQALVRAVGGGTPVITGTAG